MTSWFESTVRWIRFRVRQVWWRRFHPFVRVGTYVASKRKPDHEILGWIGLVLTVAGLVIGKDRRKLLYGATLKQSGEIHVKVVKDGRTIAVS